MEFYGFIENPGLDVHGLKELLVISRLPSLCRSISAVIEDENEEGRIYCIWGEFKINREELEYGIRFSLPKCPNALAWSVTLEEDKSILVHCTINKKQHEVDFIESIREFVNDFRDGISPLS